MLRGKEVQAKTRWLVVLGTCCITGLLGSPTVVYGEGVPSVLGTDSSSLVGDPLVAQGVQSLDGGQQSQNAVEVQRSNPEAVAERESSRTKFEGLDTEQATKLAGEDFPGVVDRAAGGPPPLPVGQKVLGFAEPDVAELILVVGREGL